MAPSDQVEHEPQIYLVSGIHRPYHQITNVAPLSRRGTSSKPHVIVVRPRMLNLVELVLINVRGEEALYHLMDQRVLSQLMQNRGSPIPF